MCSRFKLYLLLLCCIPSFLAFAKENLLIASVPSFTPFYFGKDDGQCMGVVVNVLQKVAGNLPFKLLPLPYARILHSLEVGQVDIALIFKNDAIADSVEYIGPVSKSKVIVLTSLNTPISEYTQLSTLTAIAVIRHAQFEGNFDQDGSLNKVYVESYHQAIKMFETGRVDAVVGSLIGLDYELRSNDLDVTMLDKAFPLGEKEWWLHISNQLSDPNVLSQLTSSVKKSYQPDLILQAYRQHIKNCQ